MGIKEKILKDFPILVGNKKNPYIILFDAYTGLGKSYVSNIIAQYDKSIILNNDEIRHWLNDYDNKSNLKEKLQRYRLELLLKNNNSCIMDSCFCHNWKDKKNYYDKLGYKYYIIRLICSDEIVYERINKRNDSFSRASYNDYLWMKENVPYVDDSLIDYTINTEKNIEMQVIDFLNEYRLLEGKNECK